MLKNLIETHPLARFGYGSGARSLAYIHEMRHRFYDAYNIHCRALRYIGLTPHASRHAHALMDLIGSQCSKSDTLCSIRDNSFLKEFRFSSRGQALLNDLSRRELPDLVRLRQRKEVYDEEREGNLILLKQWMPDNGEKGVILLKYNKSFEEFAAIYDLARIGEHYRIVLEPSWTPNILPSYALFAGSELELVIQCNQVNEVDFLGRLLSNTRPVLCSSSDWVDEDLFTPAETKTFDIVLVASWAKIKRHSILFKALAQLNDPSIRVALIGYPMERTVVSIQREMNRFGVAKQCEVFERIPPAQVSQIVAASKISLLLSKQEGGNKSIFESLFCDTPILVYRHHRGINMNCVNAATGMLADDHELAATMRHMIKHNDAFTPRRWAEQHTGSRIASAKLNEVLRDMSSKAQETWKTDIMQKINRPHLRYKRKEDRLAMQTEYERLHDYLLPEVHANIAR